jgi:alanyl-tRNA synthetase
MENIVIEKGIAFFGQSYSDAMQIETLRINFTNKDVENIKKAVELVRANDFITSIDLNCDGHIEYLDEAGSEFSDWSFGSQRFIVFKDTVYYYAQSSGHAGDQFDSEAIYLTELGIDL